VLKTPRREKCETQIASSKAISFTFIVILFTCIPVTVAQNSITVICGSATPQPWQHNLPGTYFHLIEAPYDLEANSNYSFEAVSASDSRIYNIPFSPDISRDLFTPSISPDGRFMAFRPASPDVGLTVWDLKTNAVARLPLQPDDLAYLPFNPDLSYQRNHNLLVWLDNHHLLLQYYFDDMATINIDWIVAQKTYTIQEMPFAIIEQPREDIVYPDFPIPEGNLLARVKFSPDARYAIQLSEQLLQGVAGSRLRVQIYDLKNQLLMYDIIPTAELYPVMKPIWMPSGNTTFILFRSPGGEPGQVSELHADDNFREDLGLQQEIENAFGMDAGITHMTPVVSPSGAYIMFAAYAPLTQTSYLLRYEPATGQATAFCDPGPGPLSDEKYPFWVPGEQHFAYYANGMVYVIGLTDGAFYTLPSDRLFVGWSEQDIFAKD
jgi:hypothetical protein